MSRSTGALRDIATTVAGGLVAVTGSGFGVRLRAKLAGAVSRSAGAVGSVTATVASRLVATT